MVTLGALSEIVLASSEVRWFRATNPLSLLTGGVVDLELVDTGSCSCAAVGAAVGSVEEDLAEFVEKAATWIVESSPVSNQALRLEPCERR
jgi:hypothetical protein